MVRFRSIAVWAPVVALMAATTTASAFCRTSSCELGEDERMLRCERDGRNCVTEGKPLHWDSPCIPYAVQQDGSVKEGIDADMLQEAAAAAFAAWAGVTCPGGGSPRFEAQFQGFVSCDRREAVCGGAAENVNVIMFHDVGWPPEDSRAVGLTTPTGGTSSGRVVDADLELNSQDFRFSGPSGDDFAQLADVLAHELGHFLGLAHSDAAGALMSEDYREVLMSRELLTEDDIAAICTVFPPGAPLSCPAPPPPAYDQCQVAPGEQLSCTLSSMTHDRDDGGCSVGGTSGGGSRALALLVAAWLMLRRRRQRYPASLQQRVPVL